MAIENYANNPITTLAAAITSTSATTLSVLSSVGFPSTGQFRILIDSELLLVTTISGTTWTVTRGAEGTTAAGHASGANVVHPLTTGALLALAIQSHGGTVTGSRRQLNFIDGGGVTWTITDDSTNGKCDISAAAAAGDPGTRALVAPVLSGFTTNVTAISGSTITQGTGLIYVAAPANNGVGCIIGYKSQPATPYSVIAKIRMNCDARNTVEAGIMFRQSSTGKMYGIYNVFAAGVIRVDTYVDNFGHVSGGNSVNQLGGNPMPWMKLSNDGTNKTFSVSSDGTNWIQFFSVAVSDYFTPDQIGFVLDGNTATSSGLSGSGMSVLSWEVTSP